MQENSQAEDSDEEDDHAQFHTKRPRTKLPSLHSQSASVLAASSSRAHLPISHPLHERSQAQSGFGTHPIQFLSIQKRMNVSEAPIAKSKSTVRRTVHRSARETLES
jgi:hypothetical protein